MTSAGSSFRHEVRADVEPFRALFLGLFFVGVGLSLDLGAVADSWPLVAAVLVSLVFEGSAIYAAGRQFCPPHLLAPRIAFAMPGAARSASCCPRPRAAPSSSMPRPRRLASRS